MSNKLEKFFFNKDRQIKFLENIYRLAKAKVYQSDIAEQLVEYGDKTEKKLGKLALESLSEGQGFTQGVKGWIEDLAWQSMLAGENTGDWAKGINDAIINLKTNNASTGLLIKALLKPVMGFVGMILFAGVLADEAFPKMMEMAHTTHLTGIQGYAYSLGKFCSNYGVMIIGFVAILLVGALFSLPHLTGEIRRKIDNFPIYKQYRLIQTASLLRSAGNLTMAGFGLEVIFEGLREHSNKYVSSHIDLILMNISDGVINVGDIMDTGLLNKSEQNSLKLLGTIGQVSETFLNSAEIHNDKLIDGIDKIKNLGANFIKIFGFSIGGVMSGGMGSLMMGLASNAV